MKKSSLLALVLALALLLSSCALVVTDPEVDAATPIVTVGDTVYTKQEVKTAVDNYLQNMSNQYYQQYNYTLDITDAEVVSSAQDTVMNALAQQAVLNQKMKEMGLDTLTEEEQAEVDETYQSYIDLMGMMMGTPSDATEEEVEELLAYYLYVNTGMTKESMVESKKQENLYNALVGDLTVSEEEVQAYFDTQVNSAVATYAQNPSAYGTAVNNGQTVYYRPAGYRMVKNLLIQMNDEDKQRMTDLNSKAAEERAKATGLLSAINREEGVDLDALLAQVTVEVTEQPAEEGQENAVPTFEAQVTDTFEATEDADLSALHQNVRDYAAAKALDEKYTSLAADATEAAYAAIAPRAEEALAKLQAGEDWDAVMAEYTDDPGMQGERATAKTGYAVCENFSGFDTAFTQAAMGLTEVGKWTDKVPSDAYGYYIIQYASDVEEGPVALDEVRETVEKAALEKKQSDTYDTTVQNWVAEAGVKLDKNSLNK